MGWRRSLEALKTWDDVAVELLWKSSGSEQSPTQPPSWVLPDRLSDELVIHWPSSYAWPQTEHWLGHLVAGFRKKVTVEFTTVPQDPDADGYVVALFKYRGQTHRIVFDFSDYMDQISQSALDASTLYFKMQYHRSGYGTARVVPGGYPVGSPFSYRFLANLRHDCDKKPKLSNVYGRFGLRYSAEIRRSAMAKLSEFPDLGYEGGTRFVRNSRFLRDMSRTRIGIDLPGNGDFCFRLIDYLSIGVCVIGPTPRTELPIPLVDGEHVVHCKNDLSDLVPLCRHYLENTEERLRIARNAREYFDRYLHRDQLAGYYLHTFLKTVET
jgi:hypothetical protein